MRLTSTRSHAQVKTLLTEKESTMDNRGSGRGGPPEAEDDDDFGDFGGFEGAEAVPNLPAAQAEAGASPWAALTTGRPDLLCAQNRFPNYLDPSDISGASMGSGGLSLNNSADPTPPVDLVSGNMLDNHVSRNQARIAENILDGTLNGAAGADFVPVHGPVNGRLPDIGLGINEGQLFAQMGPAAARDVSQREGAPLVLGEAAPPLELQVDNPVIPLERAEVPGTDRQAAGNNRAEHAAEVPVERVVEPDIENQAAQINREAENALQRQLNALQARNTELEEELSRAQQELATQRTRVEEIESRHQADLEAVRQAGNDTLAVVVEQYKEQSKVVVLEQQEQAQRLVTDTLREHTRRVEELLSTQERLHQEERERDREASSRQIAQALEESRQRQQEQFDAFLAEEKEKHRQALQEAVEAERARGEEHTREALAVEREQSRAQLEQARKEQTDLLEEAKKSHEAALEVVRQEEVEKAREQMRELRTEESERGREMTRQAMSEMREEMRGYVEEQRRADSRVRQRHLVSLDLFLESCRQQINLLKESDSGASPNEENGSRNQAEGDGPS